MTRAETLAAFADHVRFEDISSEALGRLKHNLLDTIGCAIAALGGEPVRAVREQVREFHSDGKSTLIGGGVAAPHMAAFHNGALVRYVDFMDNYLAKKQSGHPSDTTGAVLAASEYADRSGKDFLLALALSYQVFCVLLDRFPVQQHGYDHTLQLGIAIACGTSKALGLTLAQTTNAIAITASSVQGLVEVRSDYLSQWKGIASAFTGMDALFAAFLAMRGITGPSEVFEGIRGLENVIGEKLDVDWSKMGLDRVLRTSIKPYNAEVHSQCAIEGMLELANVHDLKADTIDAIDLEIFRQANNIIGEGTEAGHKKRVFSKEQADHSIFYLLAVAILDREVTPKQFLPDRIVQADVQQLLQKIEAGRKSNIGMLDSYTNAYPEEVRCKITVRLKTGTELTCEKKDFYGFYSRPMSWDDVVKKFDTLSEPFTDSELRQQIVETVWSLERKELKDLTKLLAQVKAPPI
ncbi:MAG TPA: MmgE/PrpD family protein [Candidatus Kapabacteria bacterium]|nr:MmgE/PrpD family protein [Candidatus Kapabacteria bacterium]